MQLQVSSEVRSILEKAVGVSVQCGHFFVGVEHLFRVLLDEPGALPQGVGEKYRDSLYAVRHEMERTGWQSGVPSASGEVFYTPRCIAITNQAGKLAASCNAGARTGAAHLLIAILADGLSAPSRAMDRLGLGRGECLQTLQSALHETPGVAAPPQAVPGQAQAVVGQVQAVVGEGEASSEAADAKLESLTRDLTEIARRGELSPVIGRDDAVFEILQILTRKSKNNVMLVGEAGVGKTQVVEGFALKLAQEGGKGAFPKFHILELNLAALMSGTQYRGAFEEKILGLLDKLKRDKEAVLFIDEVHLIMGAGATDGSSTDLANLLKPALARGEIRCIGATTLQEYRKFVEKDPAIERRFQMVRLEELSEEATLEVLERLRPSFEKHHGVRIGKRAMQSAVELTQRYMPNRNLPDKAIDMLDQACARLRLKALRDAPEQLTNTMMPNPEMKVTPHDLRKVVSQATAIPLEDLTAEERLHLTDLDRRLKESLVGQDEAIAKVVASVKKSRAGLSDPNRPDAVMLFLGPSGVGKTQLAKLLALHLFGSSDHLITFDMSEYIEEHSVSRLLGAPPGYVGSEEEGRLTGAVRASPFSILLFDEIEKANPRVFDILLPVLDEGRLKDTRGREASFRNCIIILTSNIGAEQLYESAGEHDRKELMDALREHFRPEFINRIDDIVPFYPLLAEDVRSILRLEINAIRKRLRGKKMGLRMYQRAYEYLAEEGYSKEFGARELRRAVDKLITAPLSDAILRNKFTAGDVIDVMMEEDKLVFRKGAPHSDSSGRPT